MTKKFTQQDAIIEKREVCFQGFYRMEKLTVRHALFRGGFSNSLSRELFLRPDAVCVLPYDPAADKVLLIEQFRIGALDKSTHPWLMEVVAGLIEEGESVENTALREGEEEAHIHFTKLIPICRYFPSPGGSDEQVYLYLGLFDSRHAQAEIGGLEQEGEDIKIHLMPFAQALESVEKDQINNAAAIMALQWLALQKLQGKPLDEVNC